MIFLVTGALEIRKRFPINDSIISSFRVLDPNSFDQFPSLCPLAMRFPNFVSSVQVLDDEWRKLRFTNIPFDYTDDEFWGRLGRITDGNEVPLFGTVCKFMKCLLALPHSSADAERLLHSSRANHEIV